MNRIVTGPAARDSRACTGAAGGVAAAATAAAPGEGAAAWPTRPGLEGAQRRPRLETHVFGEKLAHLAVDPQRLDLPAAPVQGKHPLAPQPLSERVSPGEGVEFGGQFGVAAAGQLSVDARFEGRKAGFFEPGRLCPGDRAVGHVRHRRASPQGQRIPQRRRRFLEGPFNALAPAFGDECLEAGGVEALRRDPRHIAGRLGDDDSVPAGFPERLPQPGDVHLQGMDRPIGWLPFPEILGQALGGDHSVHRGEQQRQHGPLPAPTQRDSPALMEDLYRPEDAEVHASLTPLPPLDRPRISLRAAPAAPPGSVSGP